MPDLNEDRGAQGGQQEGPRQLDPNDPLDRIAMEAMGREQADQEAEQAFLHPEDEAPGIDPAQTWAQVPRMLGGLLAMALPELHGVYTDERCLAWGVGMAAVSDKYGWDAGETIAKWGPEIALCVATVPLAVPTFAAIKVRRDAAKKREPEPAREERDITPQGEDAAEDMNPMNAKPGNFSVPT